MMRINSSHLQSCTSWSSSGVVRSGYLHRKSTGSGKLKKRWFLLRDNLLFYFARKSDTTPLGVLVLEGFSLTRVDASTFELSFPGSEGKGYVFFAKTKNDADGWVDAVTEAGFDYMQYAIKEMSELIDELGIMNQRAIEENSAGDSNSVSCCASEDRDNSENSARAVELEDRLNYCVPTAEEASRVLRIFEEMHLRFGKAIEAKRLTSTEFSDA